MCFGANTTLENIWSVRFGRQLVVGVTARAGQARVLFSAPVLISQVFPPSSQMPQHLLCCAAVLLLLTSIWYVCIRAHTHAHTNTRSQLTTFLGSLIASSSIFSSGTTTHTVSLLRLPLIKTVSPVEFKRNVHTIYVYQWSSVS